MLQAESIEVRKILTDNDDKNVKSHDIGSFTDHQGWQKKSGSEESQTCDKSVEDKSTQQTDDKADTLATREVSKEAS